jgi:hypothetical protein
VRHGGRCRRTMFTKQVSRPVDGPDPHRGRGGGAGRANSKKDLVTRPIRGFCALQANLGYRQRELRKCHFPPTMFTRQVSRTLRISVETAEAQLAERTRKDLVTGPIRVSVPFRACGQYGDAWVGFHTRERTPHPSGVEPRRLARGRRPRRSSRAHQAPSRVATTSAYVHSITSRPSSARFSSAISSCARPRVPA